MLDEGDGGIRYAGQDGESALREPVAGSQGFQSEAYVIHAAVLAMLNR
jgi:hypothetical protein